MYSFEWRISVYITLATFAVSIFPLHAADSKPELSSAFTLDAPGKKILIEDFHLHVDCQGAGDTTVLFEAGLGGSSMEWIPIQEQIAQRARACTYDRAGYAWSEPSPNPSDVRTLSREADIMLEKIGANGPLLLVGHSFGGFVIRELAIRREAKMVGMVLVDASHEDQLLRLEKLLGRSMMPRGTNFVVSPPTIPESLPDSLKQKVMAFSRMRKTHAALRSEMQYFRESTRQVRTDRSRVNYPVIVVSRGRDLYAADELGQQKTAIWDELQADLATLSPRAKLIVAQHSGHHVHTDNPALIVRVIEELLDAGVSIEISDDH